MTVPAHFTRRPSRLREAWMLQAKASKPSAGEPTSPPVPPCSQRRAATCAARPSGSPERVSRESCLQRAVSSCRVSAQSNASSSRTQARLRSRQAEFTTLLQECASCNAQTMLAIDIGSPKSRARTMASRSAGQKERSFERRITSLSTSGRNRVPCCTAPCGPRASCASSCSTTSISSSSAGALEDEAAGEAVRARPCRAPAVRGCAVDVSSCESQPRPGKPSDVKTSEMMPRPSTRDASSASPSAPRAAPADHGGAPGPAASSSSRTSSRSARRRWAWPSRAAASSSQASAFFCMTSSNSAPLTFRALLSACRHAFVSAFSSGVRRSLAMPAATAARRGALAGPPERGSSGKLTNWALSQNGSSLSWPQASLSWLPSSSWPFS
mmetsp:Transcript_31915/g.101398  ORF Transcript_31915/g.101398 Transcript_31915/m.101398 type:complete len:384 (-) Transcript_31915:98-1249(-)